MRWLLLMPISRRIGRDKMLHKLWPGLAETIWLWHAFGRKECAFLFRAFDGDSIQVFDTPFGMD